MEQQIEITYGNIAGETCNRNNCQGCIEEHDVDGGCSCHNNPPCSYCTTPREYCPECGWDAAEEQEQRDKEYCKRMEPIWAKQREEWEKKQKEWDEKLISAKNGTLKPEKIQYRIKEHTHFSQICEGICPPDATTDDILDQVKGTFGGRFEYRECGKCYFKYIAYTD